MGAGEFVERLHWTAADRLLVSLGGLSAQAATLDPSSGQVLSSQELEGTILASDEAGDDLVFLLAPSDRIGPARVAVFDGENVRVAELSEIRAGWEHEGETETDYWARQSIPALAVDPTGTRALVVPAGNASARSTSGRWRSPTTTSPSRSPSSAAWATGWSPPRRRS